MPMALRRKMRRELKHKPNIFEMIPPYGILAPGERLNVQVKFAPREEVGGQDAVHAIEQLQLSLQRGFNGSTWESSSQYLEGGSDDLNDSFGDS